MFFYWLLLICIDFHWCLLILFIDRNVFSVSSVDFGVFLLAFIDFYWFFIHRKVFSITSVDFGGQRFWPEKVWPNTRKATIDISLKIKAENFLFYKDKEYALLNVVRFCAKVYSFGIINTWGFVLNQNVHKVKINNLLHYYFLSMAHLRCVDEISS